MDLLQAKKIMGRNFIGPEELNGISGQLGVLSPAAAGISVPAISFNVSDLETISRDYILILGIPRAGDGEKLTLNKMRAHFGWDPAAAEPCFYHQDWYLKEKFAADTTLDARWYLVRKTVVDKSRGKLPEAAGAHLKPGETLPSAIVTAFAFFAYYFLSGGAMLWKNDFVWCSDTDRNGDRIYTGRYVDPKGMNKKGFNVHRHLSIRPCYGIAPAR